VNIINYYLLDDLFIASLNRHNHRHHFVSVVNKLRLLLLYFVLCRLFIC